MATGTVEPRTLPPPPPAPVESVERELLIRRQLARTGWHVRLVDLACALAVWIIGLLLLFLLAAAADHLVGLGTVGRCVALAALAGFSLWYLTMQVGPLLVRTINPAYAARTIEEATPTLKNSLINFLLLRQQRSGLKEIVYQAVERQAAADIVKVPVETAVDRTRLIHAGYALCAVMTFFAAYKILSPKDPFQTIARVLAPWAEIARPSRVQISEVAPGSTEVYYGQSVKIEATVRGVRDGDKINVLYSTADGQTIDQPIPMKLSAGNRYECNLPPEQGSAATAGGLLQNVTYRVLAGDAETFPYRLNVVAAPTIIVDRLEYQYPSYTRKVAESVRQQGDIKALEGTKITVHAIANEPIKSAFIELDPATNGGAGETVPLTADGQNARGTITLQLRPDRQTPWRTAYQVRFINERGQRSQQPILHRIEVLRDLSPEVQILKPESLRISVPEDAEQTIEVRAVDPDFGLAKLYLEGSTAGKPPLSINLLEDADKQPPQVVVPYAFRPREHELKAGDELRFAAVAEDNRTNPLQGQPEPNVTRTKEYTLVVTEAKKTDQGKSGQNQQPGGKGQAGRKPDDKSEPQNDQEKSKRGPQKDPPKKDDPKQQEQKKSDTGGEKGDQAGNQQSQNGQEKSGQEKTGDKQDGQQQNKQQPNQQQPGDQKSDGNQQQNGEKKDGQQKNDQQQNSDQQTGQQQSNPQQNGQQKDGQQSGKQQPGDQQQDQQQGGKGSQGGQSGKSSQGNDQAGEPQQSDSTGSGGKGSQSSGKSGQRGEKQPGDTQPSDSKSDGAGEPNGESTGGKAQHDGQAIERVVKEMQKRGEDSQPAGQKAPDQGENSQGKGQNSETNSQQPGNQSDSRPGGQPQSNGPSGAKGQNTPNAGTPEGNDQRLDPSGKGEKSPGKSDKTGDRLDDQKQGQNPSEQKSGGSKGGESHGADKTDKGEKSSPGKGEKRDPGAGKTGDEGAGQASEDKSGSADGNFQNRDKKKEQQPDGSKPGQNEPSPANSSNKQSDSKGGTSGENSGGGKQGAGQAGAQEGNDSAGSKSAGEQGAGKAQETGSGETGSKAGQQQPAAGKTGKSGTEKGEGSASREGDSGQPLGTGVPPMSGGQPGNSPTVNKAGQPNDQKSTDGKSSSEKPAGGGNDNSELSPNKSPTSEDQAADAANLEYARKATEMALRRLKDAEHNPDPELLDKLGWTREDLAEFLRRWESLEKSATETPTGKRDLDEALKSLGLRDPNNRRRAGGKASDNQRDLRDAGNRSVAPPKYREMFDAFRKGAARSTP